MELWSEWRQRLRRGWVEAVYRSAWVRRLFWGALFSALIAGLLGLWMVPQTLQVAVGEPAPRQIDATREVVNRRATERLREQAAAAVPDVYDLDPGVLAAQVGDLHAAFDRIRQLRRSDAPEAEKLKQLAELLPPGETDPVLKAVYQSVLAASDEDVAHMEAEAAAQLRNLMSGKVFEADAQELRANLDARWTPQAVEDRNLQLLMRGLVRSRIVPNVVLNELATEEARQKARDAVEPVKIKQGVKIVGEKEVITQEHYDILLELGLIGPKADTQRVIGITLFSLLAVGLAGLYLWRYRPDVLERDTRLVMMGSIAVMTLALTLLTKGYSPYLMPLALGTMLLTILIDAQVAVVVGMLLTLLTGLVSWGETAPLLVAGVGAFVGAYSLRRVEQRSDLIRAGLLVSLANVLAVLSLYLLQGWPLTELAAFKSLGAAGATGVLAAIVAIGTLPFLEGIFGVLTPIKLLELANPNHPLLRKVAVEAPGTYSHSMMVAHLSESAAEAVGADPMLARVGCYYHDIGKSKRPYFFTENQGGGENPHDKLPPHLSALIIANHVKDGVEMAREYRLPEEIIDFIREHHGDTLISFFYHKATENGKNEYVLEEDFRYEGPRPRSRETAIAMLADGSEASVRAMWQRGRLAPEEIEEQVGKIIKSRLEQGQLDRSDLTLRDLDTIRKTFVKILSGAYHARIEYPTNFEQTAAEAAKEAKSGDSDLEPAGEAAGDAGTGRADSPGGLPEPGVGGSTPG